jgi:hypothetical protein
MNRSAAETMALTIAEACDLPCVKDIGAMGFGSPYLATKLLIPRMRLAYAFHFDDAGI